jgi:hypothetical protein
MRARRQPTSGCTPRCRPPPVGQSRDDHPYDECARSRATGPSPRPVSPPVPGILGRSMTRSTDLARRRSVNRSVMSRPSMETATGESCSRAKGVSTKSQWRAEASRRASRCRTRATRATSGSSASPAASSSNSPTSAVTWLAASWNSVPNKRRRTRRLAARSCWRASSLSSRSHPALENARGRSRPRRLAQWGLEPVEKGGQELGAKLGLPGEIGRARRQPLHRGPADAQVRPHRGLETASRDRDAKDDIPLVGGDRPRGHHAVANSPKEKRER